MFCSIPGTSYAERFKKTEFAITNNLDAVSHSTCAMATDLKAKFIIVNNLVLTGGAINRSTGNTNILKVELI